MLISLVIMSNLGESKYSHMVISNASYKHGESRSPEVYQYLSWFTQSAEIVLADEAIQRYFNKYRLGEKETK